MTKNKKTFFICQFVVSSSDNHIMHPSIFFLFTFSYLRNPPAGLRLTGGIVVSVLSMLI